MSSLTTTHISPTAAAPRSVPERASTLAEPDASQPRPPALRVVNGEFADPPTIEWQQELEPRRAAIQQTLASVGRIRQDSFILGTGFLIARNIVMTNRHVADSFTVKVDRPDAAANPALARDALRKIRIGWEPIIDFIGETELAVPAGGQHHGQASTAHHAAGGGGTDHHHAGSGSPDASAASPCGCCKIRSVLYADDELDVALLRVSFDDTRGPEHWRRPRPLRLSGSIAPTKGRRIYLIGFPRLDKSADDEERRTVFGDVFDVKRVQPGQVTEVALPEFLHDCSTLKGNSGSCVVDLEKNVVIGLHFRGSRERVGQRPLNRAIAFSQASERLKEALTLVGVALL